MTLDVRGPGERGGRPSVRRDPTLADAVARRLAGTVLAWATRPILAAVVLAMVVGLFAAWGGVLVAIALIAGAFGLTTTADGSTAASATPVIIVALIVSGVIMVIPTRWAARNLLRTERRLNDATDRVLGDSSLDPGPVAATWTKPPPMTPAELAELDTRLAPPSAAGPAGHAESREPLRTEIEPRPGVSQRDPSRQS